MAVSYNTIRRANTLHKKTVRLRPKVQKIMRSAVIVGGVALLTLGTYHLYNFKVKPPKKHSERNNIPKLPTLPILTPTKQNKEQYSEWHHYYETVYRHPVVNEVDLNTFGWFYWFSPLKHIPHVVLRSGNTAVPANTPFTFEVKLSTLLSTIIKIFLGEQKVTPPENMFADIGFFVKRIHSKKDSEEHIRDQRFIEVLRTKSSVFTEKGVAWFFYTKGSGVFLNCQSKKLIHNRKQFKFNETKPYSKLHSNGINTLIITESDWFNGSGLKEVVHRLQGPEVIANDTQLSIHNDRGKPIATTYFVTKKGNAILSTPTIRDHLKSLKY